MALVAGVAWAARKLHIPYTIGLVLAGLGLGWVPGLPQVGLPPELFLKFLLPALLFPAALLTPWRDFRRNLRPISLLALGLVVLTLLGLGPIAHWLFPGLPLASGFVLGAIVSPTDPLAATAIAQRMNVPRRIQRVLEGEGLVNDSTGLVGYHIAVGAVVTGGFSLSQTGLEFLKMSGGGIGFGLVVGWLMTQIQKRIDDPPIEITISLLTPFAAYLPADQLGLSGVLAVVTAGLFLGWRSPLIHKAQMRLQAIPVWETIQFLLNGLVFLLIGLELPTIIRGTLGTPSFTLAGRAFGLVAAVILIRVLWVFAAAYLPRWLWPKLRERDPFPNWRHVALVAWTGMRGAVSLAAALGLPHTDRAGAPFPGRDTILFLTYCVILATLVAQGLTLPQVIRWLGVTGGGETEQEEHEARIRANHAVLDWLDELEEPISEDARNRLRSEYEARLQELEGRDDGSAPHQVPEVGRLRSRALEVERRTILELRDEHVINDEVLRHIQREPDYAEGRLNR
ncbi:MAG TPA: Na+/H+ antiporter [Verrucomicrobiae bacterium]|nr:Na+/H+ antiporter [Verrucomicrobiae bacterium]